MTKTNGKATEIYLFINFFDFTAATAADRPALSTTAGWRKEGIDYRIQLEHGHLKWKVCALCESKVVMKWSFRNWIILILLIMVV